MAPSHLTKPTIMKRTNLKSNDEVAIKDPHCSNNVFYAKVVCITNTALGIWLVVNYSKGLLRSACSERKDEWVIVETNGHSIAGPWSKYQEIIDKQAADAEVRARELKRLMARVERIKSLLGEQNIQASSQMGSLTISVEDFERLLGNK